MIARLEKTQYCAEFLERKCVNRFFKDKIPARGFKASLKKMIIVSGFYEIHSEFMMILIFIKQFLKKRSVL